MALRIVVIGGASKNDGTAFEFHLATLEEIGPVDAGQGEEAFQSASAMALPFATEAARARRRRDRP